MNIPEVKQVWNQYWQKEPNFLPVNPDHDSISALLTTLITNLPDTHLTFLDLGSGPGSRTIPILAQRKNTEIILLDQSLKALELAKKHADKKQVKTINVAGDGFTLPFGESQLDCVYSNGVNEHFLDPLRQKLIAEMVRIVKPAGYVSIMVPNKLNPFHSANKMIQEKKGTWPFGPQYDFSPNELLGRMKKAGLIKLKLFGVGAFTSWIRMLPRNEQDKYYHSPTPLKTLSDWLWKHDAQTDSWINRWLGREILVMGQKPSPDIAH